MIETIRRLLDLAEEDGIIREIKIRQEAGPARLAELKNRLEEARGRAEQCIQRMNECQARKKQFELEMEEIRGGIGKSQSKRARVKTNREYWALMKEVEDLKAGLKRKEDDVLSVMEELESLEKERIQVEQSLSEVEAEYEKLSAEIQRELDTASRELEKHLERRRELTQSLRSDILERYERLAQVRGGEALAGVRNGVCTACNLQLPPQQYNELIRNDHLMTCPNCQRIIYWLDHEEFSDASKESADGSSEA